MDETKELVEQVAEWVSDKRGKDIQIIDLDGLSVLADYFLIASGTNERQVAAIANEIEDKLSENGIEPKGIEGKNGGRWILLDYGDMVFHIFHEEDRAFYNLERLWKDGNNIEYKE